MDNDKPPKRERVTISIYPENLKWLDEQVAEHIEYRDRSHLIEIAVVHFREQIEKA